MTRTLWLAAACVTGCGRIAFDAGGDPVDATSDPDRDVAGSTCGDAFDLCDDFEAPSFDSRWVVTGGATLDTTVAHRGGASARIHVDALTVGQNGDFKLGEQTTLAPGGPTTFWVRGWFRLGGLPAGANGMEILSAAQITGARFGVYVFAHADDVQIYSQFTGETQSTDVPPPVDAWFCVVWRVVRDTTSAGELALTSDVLPSLAMPGAVTDDQSTPIRELAFGAAFAGTNVDVAQPAFDVWVDDVIVHSAPVTCAD